MNFNQRNQAVVDLFTSGNLQAARQLAAINVAIVEERIATFDQRTAELNQLLADIRANRDRLPMLAIGSYEYQEAFRVLETYRHELELRGSYAEVMSIVLRRLQPIKWQYLRN